MINSPWIRKPDFGKVVELDYDDYWERRGWEINKKLKPREKIILDLIPASARVIDIGCGNSLLPVKLKEKGCAVAVADLSPLVIKEYAQFDLTGQVFNLEETSTWSLADKYDYIVMSEVLEHTRNPEAIIQKLKAKTKYFVLTVPNSAAYQFRWGLMFRGRFFTQWVHHPSEHLRFWSHLDFLDWLAALGLVVEQSPASDGFTFFGLWPSLPNLWKNFLGYRMVYLCRVKEN